MTKYYRTLMRALNDNDYKYIDHNHKTVKAYDEINENIALLHYEKDEKYGFFFTKYKPIKTN